MHVQDGMRGQLLWTMAWPVLLYESMTVLAGMVLSGSEMGDRGMVLTIQAISALATSAVLIYAFRSCRNSGKIWAGEEGRYRGQKEKVCGRRWKLTVGEVISWTLLGISSCFFFNMMINVSGLKGLFPGYAATSQQLFEPPLWIQIAAMGILVPITEELIFRGFLYGALRKMTSFGGAAVLSAVLFGLYHGSVVQGIYAAAVGLVLAVAYEKSVKITAPVVIHGISNLTSVAAERYHLYDIEGMEVLMVPAMVVSGLVTVSLLRFMRTTDLKEEQ